MRIYNRTKLKLLQRHLRKNQTEAERKLWNIVRNKQILGLKFFRQYGAGDYILDIYCPKLKLAIEIDGGQHDETTNREKDLFRTKYLQSLNITVLRFWNNEILKNPEGIYDQIVKTINKINKNSPQSPL